MLLSDSIFTITNRGVIRFLFCFTQHYHIFLIIFLYTLLTNGSRSLSGELVSCQWWYAFQRHVLGHQLPRHTVLSLVSQCRQLENNWAIHKRSPPALSLPPSSSPVILPVPQFSTLILFGSPLPSLQWTYQAMPCLRSFAQSWSFFTSSSLPPPPHRLSI